MTARMTFDQLQRYRLAGEILAALRPRRPLKILDAGSREGFLKHYLPDDRVINLDHASFPVLGFVQGDIFALPFPASAFDAVVSLDVLEHVPAARRRIFLDELSRVSSDLLIVGSPFRDERVTEAEKLVNEFSLKMTGRENEFLVEHLTEGLPALEEIVDWADQRGFGTTVVPNGYLHRWVLMMCLNEFIAGLPDPWDFIFPANDYYHRVFYAADNRAPAYRTFVVASRSASLSREKLSALVSPPADGPLPPLDRILAEINRLLDQTAREKARLLLLEMDALRAERDKLFGELKEMAAAKQKLFDELTAVIARKTADISQIQDLLGKTIREKEDAAAELKGITSTAAYRLYRRTWGRFRSPRRP